MKIIVKAKTKAKEEKVERVGQPVIDFTNKNLDNKKEGNAGGVGGEKYQMVQGDLFAE